MVRSHLPNVNEKAKFNVYDIRMSVRLSLEYCQGKILVMCSTFSQCE